MKLINNLKNLLFIILIFFVSSLSVYSENIKQITITVYNEMGETLKNVLVFNNFVFKGLTDQKGQIVVEIPAENYYTLYFEKKGYESFMLDINPNWNNDIKIHLISNSNFIEQESHLEGKASLNGKPLSNSAFYIKGKGMLREIWTNKDGNFSTNIPDLNNSFFIYVDSKETQDKFIINYYIENVKIIKNNDNIYINFSNLNKKTFNINFVKNNSKNNDKDNSFTTTSLILYNNFVYYPFIYYWGKNIKNKNLVININNLNGKLFDNFNFFYEIFYTPTRITGSNNKYKFYTQNFKLNNTNIEINENTSEFIKEYNAQEIVAEKQLPDVKISLMIKENKFKHFILMDRTQKVILNYYTYKNYFYIPFSIFDNAYYMSVIYYPDIKDGYFIFLTDTKLTAIYKYTKIAITKKIK